MSDVAMKILECQEAAQLDHKTLLTCSNRLCGEKKDKRKSPVSVYQWGLTAHLSLNHSHDLSPHISRIAISTITTGHRHTGSSITGQCTGLYFNPTGVPQATGSSHRATIVSTLGLQLRVSCKKILSNLCGCGWWWWWKGGRMC